MKTSLLIALVAIASFFTSCKKEEFQVQERYTVDYQTIYNTTYITISGKLGINPVNNTVSNFKLGKQDSLVLIGQTVGSYFVPSTIKPNSLLVTSIDKNSITYAIYVPYHSTFELNFYKMDNTIIKMNFEKSEKHFQVTY